MIDFTGLAWCTAALDDAAKWREQSERLAYDYSTMRGPMVERDIDWTAPLAYRPMQEGDL
jgi:hypothetical protein